MISDCFQIVTMTVERSIMVGISAFGFYIVSAFLIKILKRI